MANQWWGALKARWQSASTAGSGLPVMDGPWIPNQALDQAAPLGAEVPESDDLAVADNGTVFLSAGHRIWQLAGPALAQRTVHAEFTSAVGALLAHEDKLYAALDGAGVVCLDPAGRTIAHLDSVAQRPLRAVTSVSALPDGRLVIAEGSAHHTVAEWTRDLLERRASGRLLWCTADLAQATVIADHLAWPAGLLTQATAQHLWVSESWRHRLLRVSLTGGIEPVLVNLPGYPGRLAADGEGGAWLALFAARTHLVELVLTERKFREEMMRTIDPQFWIAPSLQSQGHYLEPLQGGALKKLGIVKPWAPPRSYGLLARLNRDFECIGSLHSRAGGHYHGITAVHARGARLLAVSKGRGRVLDLSAVAAAMRLLS